jgi:hypothetical protein
LGEISGFAGNLSAAVSVLPFQRRRFERRRFSALSC